MVSGAGASAADDRASEMPVGAVVSAAWAEVPAPNPSPIINAMTLMLNHRLLTESPPLRLLLLFPRLVIAVQQVSNQSQQQGDDYGQQEV